MISTAMMVPVGSSATNPFRLAKTHQLVHNPVVANITSRPINISRLD